MLKLLVREAVVDLRKVDVRGRSSDLRQAVGHVGGDPGVGGPGPIPRLEARGVAGPPDATNPDGVRMKFLRGAIRREDEDDAAVRRIRDVEGAEWGKPFLGLHGWGGVARPAVGGQGISQAVPAVLRDDRSECLWRSPRAAKVGVRLEARHDERVGAERLVPDRVERVFDDAVERHDIRRLAVGLDDGDVDESRLNLHVRIREALQSVPAHRARRPQRGPELVGNELVEDSEAFVVVFRAGDERVDVLARVDRGVRVSARRRLEHQFFPVVFGRRGPERGHPDPDDADPHVLPSGRGSRTWEVRDRSKDCRRRKPLRFAALFIGFGNGFRLPLYYLDVETTGDDPQQDRIVTVQYQALADDLTPTGLFQVIAEWAWGEKQVIQTVLDKGVLEPTWDFVPLGNRLRFDLTFLIERATKWKLIEWDMPKLKYFWFTKPYLDLAPVLVMLNRGPLSGSRPHSFAAW